MSTFAHTNSLSEALFGKARRRVLAALLGHPDEAIYLRQLARGVGMGLGAVQQEVRRLSEAGILLRTVRADIRSTTKRTRSARSSTNCGAWFPRPRAWETCWQRRSGRWPAEFEVALLFGSVARGEEHRGSDVDILVVGEVSFAEVVAAVGKAQLELGREVNPVVYPPDELRRKLAAGHHFLTSVLETDKLFLIGDQRELAAIG